MGRGDKKTRKGKITAGSFGNIRQKKKKTDKIKVAAAKAAKSA